MSLFKRRSSRIQSKEISELESLVHSLQAIVNSHQSGVRRLNTEELYAVRLQLLELERSEDSKVVDRVLDLSQEVEELIASGPKRRKFSDEDSSETCSFREFDVGLLTNRNFVTLPLPEDCRPDGPCKGIIADTEVFEASNQNFVTLPSPEVCRPAEPCEAIVADTEVFEAFENRHAHILSPDIFEGCPEENATQMDVPEPSQPSSPNLQIETYESCQAINCPDQNAEQMDTTVSSIVDKGGDVEVSHSSVPDSQHRRITESLERLDRQFELEEFEQVTRTLNEMIDTLKTSWKKISGDEEPAQPIQVKRIIPAFYTTDQRETVEAEPEKETNVERDNEILKLQYMMLDCADDFTDDEDETDPPDWKAIYKALDEDFCDDGLKEGKNKIIQLPDTSSKL